MHLWQRIATSLGDAKLYADALHRLRKWLEAEIPLGTACKSSRGSPPAMSTQFAVDSSVDPAGWMSPSRPEAGRFDRFVCFGAGVSFAAPVRGRSGYEFAVQQIRTDSADSGPVGPLSTEIPPPITFSSRCVRRYRCGFRVYGASIR